MIDIVYPRLNSYEQEWLDWLRTEDEAADWDEPL